MTKLMPDGELAFETFEDCAAVADVLLRNDYTVLMSKEDKFFILNYLYAQYSDRNAVIFMDRGLYEIEEMERNKKDDWEDEWEILNADEARSEDGNYG